MIRCCSRCGSRRTGGRARPSPRGGWSTRAALLGRRRRVPLRSRRRRRADARGEADRCGRGDGGVARAAGFRRPIAKGGNAVSYVQGFVIPVPVANKDAYRDMAAKTAPVFRDYGAQRVVECWGESAARRPDHRFPQGGEGRGGRECRLLVDRLARQGDLRMRRTTRSGRIRAWRADGAIPFDGKRIDLRRVRADLRYR